MVSESTNFLAPGSDGEPDAGRSLWRKGLVYTIRSRAHPIRQGYRISAGFKRAAGGAHPFTGFHDAYRRVTAIANRRISELSCPDAAEPPESIILGHAWQFLGDNIVTALVTLGLKCPTQGADLPGEAVPSDSALRSPGGASLDELALLSPQRSDEIYNEFDFTDLATSANDLITVSYGESISDCQAVDFLPFVERAETVTRWYHGFLHTMGEVSDAPVRIRRREWFLASETFVTVHICFER